MPSAAQIESILHDYLDRIEDVELDAVLRLAQRLGGLSAQQWLSLSRGQTIDRLALILATDLYATLGRDIVPASMTAAGRLTDRGERQITAALDRISTGRGLGDLMPPQAAARTARRMAASLVEPLTSVRSQIDRLIADLPPTSPERAARLLDRIRAEVIAPLRGTGAVGDAVRSAMGAVAQEALLFSDLRLKEPRLSGAALEERAANMPARWIAALVRTCQDCLPRHGQLDRMESWRARGLPRTGWSVCASNCKCMLVPEEASGYAATVAPLQRASAKLIDSGSPRGLTVRVPAELLQRESRGIASRENRADEIRAAYGDDIRVRRALRLLGSVNAGGETP